MNLVASGVEGNVEVLEESNHAQKGITRQTSAEGGFRCYRSAGKVDLDFVQVVSSSSSVGIEWFVHLARFYVKADGLPDLRMERTDGRS